MVPLCHMRLQNLGYKATAKLLVQATHFHIFELIVDCTVGCQAKTYGGGGQQDDSVCKVPAAKAHYLSSIPRTYVVERTNSYKLSSNLCMHAHTHTMGGVIKSKNKGNKNSRV